MDSPVRKQQKRNDYLRHKMFRKINRRKKAERKQAIEAPMKELRKRLRRYDGGKKPDDDIVYETQNTEDGTVYRVHPSAFGAKELNVTTPDIVVKPDHNTRVAVDNFYKKLAQQSERQWYINPITGEQYMPQGGPLKAIYPEFDLLTLSPLLKTAGNTILNSAINSNKNRIIGLALKHSIDPKRMQTVQNAFRNQEWSNFLATQNGDNYYRIAKDAKLLNPEERYFISHTTPWEEFVNFGEHASGAKRLYEFPTKTFGKLKSTTSNGIRTDYDVAEMGKNHLLYGNTASGQRMPIKILSDENANALGIDPTVIGVAERPLTKTGYYDNFPVYENIHLGNQTTIDGRTFNDAVINLPHQEYYPTDGGIQKVLHVIGFKNGKSSGIHIKPQNRGKFTALKKRTGKSASWFKAHGTPAQKKMATFALNAKKWKH